MEGRGMGAVWGIQIANTPNVLDLSVYSGDAEDYGMGWPWNFDKWDKFDV